MLLRNYNSLLGVQTSPSPFKDTTVSRDKNLRCFTIEYFDEREKILEKTKQELKSCKEAVDYYKNEIEHLKKDIKDLQLEKVKLENALKKEKNRNKSLKQQLQSSIKKLNDTETELTFLEEELRISECKLEGKGKEIEMQEKRNERLKARFLRRHYSKDTPTPKLPRLPQNQLPSSPETSDLKARRTSLPEPQQSLLPNGKVQNQHMHLNCTKRSSICCPN